MRIFYEVSQKKKRRWHLHLEVLPEWFQLAAVLFCQLLSHLHLFSQSIMKHCNLFMGCSGSSCENLWRIQTPGLTGKKKKKKAFSSILKRRHLFISQDKQWGVSQRLFSVNKTLFTVWLQSYWCIFNTCKIVQEFKS